MEPGRPIADRYLLDLLESHHFRANDFGENRKGTCRLSRQLAHTLAETAPAQNAWIAPFAERVAQTLADDPDLRVGRIPTPLTQANRRRAQAPHRRRTHNTPPDAPRPSGNCAECGEPVQRSGDRCPPCRDSRNRERLPALNAQGLQALAEARSEGRDPAHGGVAGRQRSAAMVKRNREAREWGRDNERPDPEVFNR